MCTKGPESVQRVELPELFLNQLSRPPKSVIICLVSCAYVQRAVTDLVKGANPQRNRVRFFNLQKFGNIFTGGTKFGREEALRGRGPGSLPDGACGATIALAGRSGDEGDEAARLCVIRAALLYCRVNSRSPVAQAALTPRHVSN